MKNIFLSAIALITFGMAATEADAQYYIVKDGKVIEHSDADGDLLDYISFDKPSFTVSFDSGEGATAVKSQEIQFDSPATKPANPKRGGYSFKGWYNGEELFDFTQPINGDVNLTAQWKKVVIPDAVDLGLPSGTKWASFNIGATAPEKYGYYFAWGETEPKSTYSSSNYKFTTDGGSTFTKYTINGKTELEDEDDVALLDGDWQMPTIDDWQELIDNCTWDWQPAGNTIFGGVAGYKVTSKKDGYTDKSIFLPAAGSSLEVGTSGAGSEGRYWSRSLGTSSSGLARDIVFNSESKNTANFYRTGGISVRAVQPVIFKVTFDSNGGSAVDAQDVRSNAKATKPDVPEREGYIFKGWYNGEDPFDFTQPINGDINLTAQWKEVVIPDAVDLGLPSGTKWAPFNIGATAPEEYGDYFAWGEVKPKNEYYWSNYKLLKDGGSSSKDINKYTFADGKNDGTNWYDEEGTFVGDGKKELEDEDDVAVQLWGDDWQIPTIEDWQELIDNCSWEWQKAGNTTFGGVAGYKVTSKKEGYTGKYIFLPAAGFRDGADLKIAGSVGDYWSRSLYTNGSSNARFLFFNSGGESTSYANRYNGISVRAVQRK